MSFNEDGYLPPGFHDWSLQEVATNLEQGFSGSQTRVAIAEGYQRLIAELARVGLRVEQWLGGRFCSAAVNPAELDLVSLVDMVGRILTRLKARGVLRQPPRTGISTRPDTSGWRRPYAVRKPKGYAVLEPGDLVQLDTLDVRPLPGMVLKHFTARDVVSRWDVVEAHRRATANTAKAFLDALQ